MFSKPRSFSRQVLLSQLAVIVLVLALAGGTFAWLGARAVTAANESRALATARTLAEDPQVRQEVTAASDTGDPDPSEYRDGPIQDQAMHIRDRAGVQFVVVTDDHGIRLAHPDAALIGGHVSTSPDRALAGHEEVTQEAGTLGYTVRAKVPVYSSDDDGRVVGLVSVGIQASVLGQDIRHEILAVAAVAVAALAVGALVSLALVRRLDRATLQVGPEELANMVRHQEAVLYGLDDGVLGFAQDARVTLSNQRARELLGWSGDDDAGPVPAEIRAMVDRVLPRSPLGDSSSAPERRRVALGDRILLVTAVAVRRGDVSVGAVVTVQDETQVLTMAEQLESVTAMAQALRAQRHEFANRLHTVMGLVTTGATDEAVSYMGAILRRGPVAAPVEGLELITDAYLRALLEAKGTVSAEAGITLRVAPDSLVLNRISEPEDVTLILGNLIDNAIRAALQNRSEDTAAGAGQLPLEPSGGLVELHLLSEGADLHGVVTDTGPGIDEDMNTSEIFTEGVTGRGETPSPGQRPPWGERHQQEHGHGIGLALCRRVAQRRGGRVWVIAAHDERLGGASFGIHLRDVLEHDTPVPEEQP